jgi:hypothetical protein
VDIGGLTRQQRALVRRHYLGFVFQGFNLLNRTSAQENVELPLVYRGTPAAERHRRAREALAAVGLTGWETHTPAELSGGQMQRVAIARAIVTEPSVCSRTADRQSDTARGVGSESFCLNRERDYRPDGHPRVRYGRYASRTIHQAAAGATNARRVADAVQCDRPRAPEIRRNVCARLTASDTSASPPSS